MKIGGLKWPVNFIRGKPEVLRVSLALETDT